MEIRGVSPTTTVSQGGKIEILRQQRLFFLFDRGVKDGVDSSSARGHRMSHVPCDVNSVQRVSGSLAGKQDAEMANDDRYPLAVYT